VACMARYGGQVRTATFMLARGALASGPNGILLIGAAVVPVGRPAALALVRVRDFHHRPQAAPTATSTAETVRA